ncbi:uncharacterized protein LOC110246905 [Exaiptasia diaphana]|uniref:Uncharacterized protein n=1 Tax=Exaiptasia diaphana TaxID=2652724 RepID=A0A913XR76_EXADI|nr:uncharacterized protein LOC110246905 [Exaiptasia diaphana]
MVNTETLPELKSSKGDGHSGDSATEIDQKLLELATQEEDTEEWRRNFKKMSKELAEKMANPDNPKNNDEPYNNQSIGKLQDSARKKKLIASVKTKLSTFSGPLPSRAKDSLSSLDKKWNDLSNNNKKRALRTLSVINSNIKAYGNAGEDPVSAMKAAITILASISSNFRPKGQLANTAPGFASAFLGLHGKKGKQSLELFVGEIDGLLAGIPGNDDELIRRGDGVLTALKQTKVYLDGVSKSKKPLSTKEMALATHELKRSQGLQFLGELASKITQMFENNDALDGKQAIRYCEMYAILTAFRDIILTQYISIIPTNNNDTSSQNNIDGVLADQVLFRKLAGKVLGKFYEVDYDSAIIPYFDPDVSVITDTYSTKMLNVANYDRTMTGLYCLSLFIRKNNKFHKMVWRRKDKRFQPDGNPYTTITIEYYKRCHWKLVPHAGNTYSIVTKYKSEDEKTPDYSGSFLSWTVIDQKAYVDINAKGPILWEIKGQSSRIKNKTGCGKKKSKWCDWEMGIKERAIQPSLKKDVGQLVPPNSYGTQWLFRKPGI